MIVKDSTFKKSMDIFNPFQKAIINIIAEKYAQLDEDFSFIISLKGNKYKVNVKCSLYDEYDMNNMSYYVNVTSEDVANFKDDFKFYKESIYEIEIKSVQYEFRGGVLHE